MAQDAGAAEVTLVLRFQYDDEVDYARTIVNLVDWVKEEAPMVDLVSLDVSRRELTQIERR